MYGKKIEATKAQIANRKLLHTELDKMLDRLLYEEKNAANIDLIVFTSRAVCDDEDTQGSMVVLEHEFKVETWTKKSGVRFVEEATLKQTVRLEGTNDLGEDTDAVASVFLYVDEKGNYGKPSRSEAS